MRGNDSERASEGGGHTSKRQQVAFEAACLLVRGEETDVTRARERAARQLARPGSRSGALPSKYEIAREVESLGLLDFAPVAERVGLEGRFAAYALLRTLRRFDPQVSGGVISGEALRGGTSFIELAGDPGSTSNLADAIAVLEARGVEFAVHAGGNIEVFGRFPFRLSFRPRVEGPVQVAARPGWLGLPELEARLARECPWHRFGEADFEDADDTDQYEFYQQLLQPLEEVKLDPRWHPEGDALFHSLQVFDLTCREEPYDGELLMAALLHEAGQAIDPVHPVEATLDVLADHATERTLFFIRHLPDARAEVRGTLGERVRRQLRESEDHEQLLVLARADIRGRVPGVRVPELAEAIDYLRELARLGDVTS